MIVGYPLIFGLSQSVTIVVAHTVVVTLLVNPIYDLSIKHHHIISYLDIPIINHHKAKLVIVRPST